MTYKEFKDNINSIRKYRHQLGSGAITVPLKWPFLVNRHMSRNELLQYTIYDCEHDQIVARVTGKGFLSVSRDSFYARTLLGGSHAAVGRTFVPPTRGEITRAKNNHTNAAIIDEYVNKVKELRLGEAIYVGEHEDGVNMYDIWAGIDRELNVPGADIVRASMDYVLPYSRIKIERTA